MLKFIIYEDNPEHVQKVKSVIAETTKLHDISYQLHIYDHYDDSIMNIINDPHDKKIYILDVEVPEVSGIEIASRIRESDWKSLIIFVTAHRKYKDDVIYSRLVVLDYIQKQALCKKRLEDTINVALKIIECDKYLVFTSHHIEYQLAFDEINYVEKITFTKKCQIVTDKGLKIEISMPLHKIQNKLDKRFYQTHKSCIVNVNKIHKINSDEGMITFTNGTSTYLLSTRRQKGLKEYVKLFK